MFDVGWPEMLVIAIVMIVVVGPKDLPKMLRTFGKMATKMRGMAGDFRKQFDEALKEAELSELKSAVDSVRNLDPRNEIKKQLNPFEQAGAEVKAGLEAAMKPAPKAEAPAAAEAAPPAVASAPAAVAETPKPKRAKKAPKENTAKDNAA